MKFGGFKVISQISCLGYITTTSSTYPFVDFLSSNNNSLQITGTGFFSTWNCSRGIFWPQRTYSYRRSNIQPLDYLSGHSTGWVWLYLVYTLYPYLYKRLPEVVLTVFLLHLWITVLLQIPGIVSQLPCWICVESSTCTANLPPVIQHSSWYKLKL